MKLLNKILLFISSFIPLYIMLIIKEIGRLTSSKNFCKDNITIYVYWTVLFLLLIVSIFGIIKIIVCDKGNRTKSIEVNLEKQGDNVISYIMTYIVPLLSINPNDITNLIQNIFLFIIIGIIYVQQNLLFLNPIFSLLNYKFYKNENNEIILSKLNIEELKLQKKEGRKVYIRQIDEKFYIIKGIRK